MNKPTIYLAGAIRDSHPEDIEWREEMIMKLKDRATFLNPLGGKTFNKTTKDWRASGVVPGGRFIVKHDFWAVDVSNIVVFNFIALADRYPNLGTLIEFGRSTGTGALIYSIVPTTYTGHDNAKLFHLHPFIEENSAVVFPNVQECIDFLSEHLLVLSGVNPHFSGVLE